MESELPSGPNETPRREFVTQSANPAGKGGESPPRMVILTQRETSSTKPHKGQRERADKGKPYKGKGTWVKKGYTAGHPTRNAEERSPRNPQDNRANTRGGSAES